MRSLPKTTPRAQKKNLITSSNITLSSVPAAHCSQIRTLCPLLIAAKSGLFVRCSLQPNQDSLSCGFLCIRLVNSCGFLCIRLYTLALSFIHSYFLSFIHSYSFFHSIFLSIFQCCWCCSTAWLRHTPSSVRSTRASRLEREQARNKKCFR